MIKVRCKICKKCFCQLYTHLTNKHNLSSEEYLERFPKAKISSSSHLLKISKGHFKFYKKNPRFKSKYYKSHPEVKEKIRKSVNKMYKEHPEVKEQISVSTTKTFSKPELRKKISKHRRKYFKEHPQAGKQISKRQKKFYKKHPESAKWHSKVMTELFEKNPRKRKEYSRLRKRTYKEHPEYWEKMGETRQIYFEKHPEWGKMMSKMKKELNKRHPEIMRKLIEAAKKVNKPYIKTKQGYLVQSKGEKKIADYLYKHKITCLQPTQLFFVEYNPIPDFYLPKYKVYLEYDGNYLGMSEERNKIKKKCYKKYNIPVLWLYPKDLKNLDNSLLKKLKQRLK